MRKLLSTHTEFLLINLLLLAVLGGFMLSSSYRPSDDLLLFSPDANTYFSCGTEFFHWDQHGASIVRPFLYSLILRSTHAMGGAQLVVVFQLICWVVIGNLVYFALLRGTRSRIFSVVGLGVYAANFSLIVFAFHGLTEVVSALGLAILCYYLSGRRSALYTVRDYLILLTILGLLTVIKPLFWYPFLGTLLLGWISVFRDLMRSRKVWLYLALILLPAALQLTTMQVKYHHFGISRIGKLTFDKYLFTQGMARIEGLEHEAAQERMWAMNEEQKRSYLKEHARYYFDLVITNTEENIGAEATFFSIPEGYRHPSFFEYMTDYNQLHRDWYRFFFSAFIALGLYALIRKRFFAYWRFWVLGGLLYYCLFTSGISFWQGDRLVIFTLPLWIVLYLQLLKTYLDEVRELVIHFKAKRLNEIRSH